MQKQTERLEKLLTRKREYLQYLQQNNGKQKSIDAISAEIYIIEEFRNAYNQEFYENGFPKDAHIGELHCEIIRLKEIIMKLEGICFLYGIELWEMMPYLINDKNLIIHDLLQDQKEGITRVPDKHKQFLKTDIEYYGEKELTEFQQKYGIGTRGQH